MPDKNAGAVALSNERSRRTRRSILAAATRCFGTHGLANVSMETVAEEAGVTKPTVYAHFGSKAGLFEAALAGMLRRMQDEPLPEVASLDELEAALLAHATAHLEVLLDEANLGLLRATAAEAMRRPEWAQELLVRVVSDELALWMERAMRKRLLRVGSSEVAVETFWGLVKGPLFYPVLNGLRPRPGAQERERVVKEAVRVFMAAYGGKR